MKIGVFICHCGENISSTVDCPRVAKECESFSGVEYSIDYKYMCSDPGQNLIKEAKRFGYKSIKNSHWVVYLTLMEIRLMIMLCF